MAEKYIAGSRAIAARKSRGKMMVMSAVDPTFFALTEIASAILQAEDGRTSLLEIVAGKSRREFNVDQEHAQFGFERFADEHSQCGILPLSDQALLDSSGSGSPERQ